MTAKNSFLLLLVSTLLISLGYTNPVLSKSPAREIKQAGESTHLYFPLVIHQPLLPVNWRLYLDPWYRYRFVVPNGWQVRAPSYNAIMDKDITTVTAANFTEEQAAVLPPSFDDPNWPASLFKIEFVTFDNVDPQFALEEQIRASLESDTHRIQEIVKDNRYPNGVFALTTRTDAPTVQGKVFVTLYPAEQPQHLMVISVTPRHGWENETVQFIINSLDFGS
jgi:hypothetical protein